MMDPTLITIHGDIFYVDVILRAGKRYVTTIHYTDDEKTYHFTLHYIFYTIVSVTSGPCGFCELNEVAVSLSYINCGGNQMELVPTVPSITSS